MKYIFIVLSMLVSLSSFAADKDPKGIKNSRKGIYTILTTDEDGHPLNKANGFFIDDQGTLLTTYTSILNAKSATYTDVKKKSYTLHKVSGADELYDVVKLQGDMPKKAYVLKADTVDSVHTQLFLPTLPTVKHNYGTWIDVTHAERVTGGCPYYTLRHKGGEQYNGLPLFNEEGHVIATVQPSMDTDTLIYALGIQYAMNLNIKALSINEQSYSKLKFPIALPAEEEQALVSLFLIGDQGNETRYAHTIEEFIEQFPESHEGYLHRAALRIKGGTDSLYALAEADMNKAVEVTKDKKDDAHFQIAKQIMQFAADTTRQYKDWTYERAIKESEQAYALNPLPIYLQQKGDIYVLMHDYDKAYQCYSAINQTNLASPDNYLRMALLCEQRGDSLNTIVNLLDSAVNFNGEPLTSKAAPYLLERALFQARHQAYRLAIKDFNEYEHLLGYVEDDRFYYMREQAEINARMFEQALKDIDHAITIAPNNAVYYLEKAIVNIRINRINVAFPILNMLVKQFPQDMNCNRLLGYCYAEMGQMDKAMTYLETAKSLGDSNAAILIEKYSK